MPITKTRIRAGLLGLPIVTALAIAGCGGTSNAKPTANTPVAAATTALTPAPKHHLQLHHPRAHQAHPRATISAAPAGPTTTPPAPAPVTSATPPPPPNPSPPPPPATKPAPTPPPPPASSGIPQHGGGDGDSDNNGGPSDGDGNV